MTNLQARHLMAMWHSHAGNNATPETMINVLGKMTLTKDIIGRIEKKCIDIFAQ